MGAGSAALQKGQKVFIIAGRELKPVLLRKNVPKLSSGHLIGPLPTNGITSLRLEEPEEAAAVEEEEDEESGRFEISRAASDSPPTRPADMYASLASIKTSASDKYFSLGTPTPSQQKHKKFKPIGTTVHSFFLQDLRIIKKKKKLWGGWEIWYVGQSVTHQSKFWERSESPWRPSRLNPWGGGGGAGQNIF